MLKWTIINGEWVKAPPPHQDYQFIVAFDFGAGDEAVECVFQKYNDGEMKIISSKRVEKKGNEIGREETPSNA